MPSNRSDESVRAKGSSRTECSGSLASNPIVPAKYAPRTGDPTSRPHSADAPFGAPPSDWVACRSAPRVLHPGTALWRHRTCWYSPRRTVTFSVLATEASAASQRRTRSQTSVGSWSIRTVHKSAAPRPYGAKVHGPRRTGSGVRLLSGAFDLHPGSERTAAPASLTTKAMLSKVGIGILLADRDRTNKHRTGKRNEGERDPAPTISASEQRTPFRLRSV